MNQLAPPLHAPSLLQRAQARVKRWLPRTPLAWLTCTAIPLALGASFLAFSQATTPPDFKPINLANEPLYAASTIDKPTMALALSVEFPTLGAQYLGNTYDSATEYLGYYNAESCYNYNNTPTETPGTGQIKSDYKRFDLVGAAASRQCTDAFSGNFLNWASSSAIDMLRLALSGGDRYVDTADLTLLQRAVLPNGDPSCFWNSSNFPGKRIPKDGGGTNKYWGAVPNAMITAAAGSDIMVSSGLDKIYFKVGSSNSGSCTDNSAYRLSTTVVGNSMGTPMKGTRSNTTGLTSCINSDTGFCSFSGAREVWYGSGSQWRVVVANNGLYCPNGCDSVLGTPGGTASNNKVYTAAVTGTYTGSWSANSSDGSPINDGAFFARLQVCNVDTNGELLDNRDYGMCQQYPSGKYKPTGVIQKYSDQMRLAAFGYLMDQTASYSAGGRYGGVLRAPMKYVGSKTFDTTGLDNTPTSGNAAAEWNAFNGIFYRNPDGDTSQTKPISGVINYLNQFGRTGPTPGRYKKFDPVGELHYEALRYLQGLPPTADAISNLGAATGDLYDGYPVYTNWVDPYENRSEDSDYSCVKSNIIVIGDVNTHDGNRLPTANAANNIPDIAGWRTTAGRFESQNTTSTYLDGANISRRTNGNPTRNTSMPTATDRSQIIGSAYWARTHDIRGEQWTSTTGANSSVGKKRPGLRVKTFLFDVSENGGSDVFATRSTSNQFLMAAKYGGFETDPTNRGGNPYNTWGNPFIRQTGAAPTGVADDAVWKKTTGPGDPQSYYLQSDARGVLKAFDEIFSRASSASRSIAGGASSSSSVSSNTALYTARFDTSNWSGDVIAEPLTANATTKVLTLGTQLWSAANRLDTRASAATTRKIIAGKESSTANPAAQNFTWADIDSTLKTHLGKSTPTATADTLGQDRLNYIRGDKTKEANPFRVRSSLLGDIINSNVVYSGIPAIGNSGAAYAAFRTANASRTTAVFAGANDGMLHAFNATTGDELFGYIPSWLGPNLSALVSPTFATTHVNYVDAPMAVGDAQVAFTTANAATDWKTVLVSGTGGGGSGVFALDVTNPSAFDANKVMWEFKRSDDPDIGQVIGQPRIMKFRTSGTSTTPTYRWFAVVASGVNNYVMDAAGRFSSTGKPTLFLLALDKSVGTAWVEGTNYYKISVPVDATLAANTAAGLAPGLANFNALYGRSGEVTDIFMGDLHGKLWKLTFNPAGTWLAPSDWNMNKLSFFNKGTAASPDPYPMYTAKTGDSTPKPQPITAAPTLFSGPVIGSIETFYVSFGTGKYLETSDSTSSLTNSFYTVYDNGSASADASPINSAISGRGRLIAGSVDTSNRTITVAPFKWGRPATNATTTSRAGWYFDMPGTGEKLVSHIVDLGSLTGAFNTVIPGAGGSTPGSCSVSPGTGNQYAMNIETGMSTYIASTVGIPGPAVFFTNDEETTETKNDSTGRRIRTTIKRGLTVGQSGISPAAQTPSIPETIGRLSWRQIFDYQDMKNN